jgi:hyperosmotically inducible periplasmic protein
MEHASRSGYGLILGIGLAMGFALAQYAPAPAPAPSLASDDALRSRVDLSLSLHRALRPFAIDVGVRQGRVVLSGSVDDPMERELAGRIAGGIDGIRVVDNRLVVEPDRARWLVHTAMTGEHDIDDRALQLAVRAQLRWHRSTQDAPILVRSRDRHIVLAGTVDTLRQRDAAQRIAARTVGVQSVDNRLEVRGLGAGAPLAAFGNFGRELADAWITTKVRTALLYESNVRGLDLRVRTSDGVVILSGLAANRTEIDLASEIAAAIHGVRRVDTHYVDLST